MSYLSNKVEDVSKAPHLRLCSLEQQKKLFKLSYHHVIVSGIVGCETKDFLLDLEILKAFGHLGGKVGSCMCFGSPK